MLKRPLERMVTILFDRVQDRLDFEIAIFNVGGGIIADVDEALGAAASDDDPCSIQLMPRKVVEALLKATDSA